MIFPDWNEAAAQEAEEVLPLYTDWAVDWTAGRFALREGQPYLVTGNAALEGWIRCALHPESERYACSAHSGSYGNQLGALLGERDSGVWESNVRREIRETLLTSPYITGVDHFVFSRWGSRAEVRFTVTTVYGEREQQWIQA